MSIPVAIRLTQYRSQETEAEEVCPDLVLLGLFSEPPVEYKWGLNNMHENNDSPRCLLEEVLALIQERMNE
jgi:hypothetical protein